MGSLDNGMAVSRELGDGSAMDARGRTTTTLHHEDLAASARGRRVCRCNPHHWVGRVHKRFLSIRILHTGVMCIQGGAVLVTGDKREAREQPCG